MLVAIFSLLLLAHDPLVFWNDDYELSILPVCADMARAWNHGEVPLLSPYSWICGNLAGEFQYGVFSVFMNAVIVAVWKFPLVFAQQAAALSIVHLVVLAMGAFLLGRERNLSTANAMLIAIVAALNGWIICWGATDWLGALTAFTWLPWAWWAAERALDPRRTRWRFLWPPLFVYLLVTGGFPYTVLMLGLVIAWLMARTLLSHQREKFAEADLSRACPRPARLHSRFRQILPLVIGVALGLGLAAPAWLALFDYVHGSLRAAQDPTAHFQWLVPWRAWPALILPSWTVNWVDFSTRLTSHRGAELACGLVPPAALIAGFLTHRRKLWKPISWEIALLLIVAGLCMLPTASVFRWSFRWLPLLHLVLALCAGEALQLTTERRATFDEGKGDCSVFPVINPPMVALVLVIILAGFAHILGVGGHYLWPLAWIFAGLGFAWLVVELPLNGFAWLREWTPVMITFLVLLATYFCIPPNCGVPKYRLSQTLKRPKPLDQRRLYISFYPAPEQAYRIEAKSGAVGQTVRPGSASMWARLRFINGYSPIRPAGVAREFATAIHGEIDPGIAQWLLGYEAQTGGLLERLGVDGIIIAQEWNWMPQPQPANAWELAAATAEGRVFHRRNGPLPTVRSVNSFGEHGEAEVRQIAESRNAVSASVSTGDKPALLAFSRPFFRGYQARIDGRVLPVQTTRNLVPLVELPAHISGRLTLRYRPWWLVAGGAVSLGSAMICLVSAIFSLGRPARAQ